MAKRAICKETIKKNTISQMRNLGVYKPEYDPVIEIYAEMREQYERLTDEFKKGNYKVEERTADGGSKKAPLVATLESLRKDILQYSDRLCLNPKANQVKGKAAGGARKSGLAAALEKIET